MANTANGHDRIRIIRHFDDVVKLLGGPKALSRKLGEIGGKEQSGQAVHVWRDRNRKIPPKHYVPIQYLLLEKGCLASPAVFAFNAKAKGVSQKFAPFWIELVAECFAAKWKTPRGRKQILRAHKTCYSDIEPIRAR